jgi:hypothetical protein
LLWTQRQDIGPSARLRHALAYDAGNQRTLLVGGDGLSVLLGDAWLWDGETWTQVEDIGPSGRTGHAIAYDSARSRVVLFGGYRSSGELADTWEWDGEAWTQIEDTGPRARALHALAYDSTRSRVVLFGGEAANAPLGDTWEWDGDEWTQVADTGPSPRRGHAMCFEASAQRTVLFGGSNGSNTWAWNGTGWTELNDVGPPPCDGTALVSTGQSTLLFGGRGREGSAPLFGPLFGLTWELNGADWTERQDIGPAPRFGHAMAYDTARGRAVLFGGSGALPTTEASLFADTWELPAGAETGPGDTGPGKLDSFTISPNTVQRNTGTPVQLEVRLKSPEPSLIRVLVQTTGASGLAAMYEITVVPGTVAATIQIPAPMNPGVIPFTASLWGQSLSATLTIV